MGKPNIPYGKQYIDEEDIQAVIKTLKSDYLTTGPVVKEFEEAFADYVGSKYAVAVANGTAALHLACMVLDLEKDDEIITSPITFAASANCALYVGAKPVFADIDKDTYNTNPEEIEKKITSKTKAIIPVHFAGLPCNMEEIKKIADKHNIKIIEDACHALGAGYNNTKIGDCAYSNMAVFSFHPVKHITTGEGGMITTNLRQIYEKLIKLRTHGITKEPEKMKNEIDGGWYYEMQDIGYNYRLTDFQSALGLSQLKKINKFIDRRKQIARYYKENLTNLPIKFQYQPENSLNSYHLFTIELTPKANMNRKELYDKLKEKGIYTQVHYIPVHLHSYYQKLGYNQDDYPISEQVYQKILSIPIYYSLKNKELEYIIKQLRELLN